MVEQKNELDEPELVLRLGFAGNRNLPAAKLDSLREALLTVFETIGTGLKEISTNAQRQGKSQKIKRAKPITRFYSDRPPLLRLVTGLAEGGDALAAETFLEKSGGTELRLETAAVIPFDRQSYANSRDEDFRTTFEALYNSCAYVLELDGVLDNPSTDTPLAKRRMSRAIGASDAPATPLRYPGCHCRSGAEMKAGGTLETVQRALDFDIPVVLIEATTARLVLFEPEDDFEERLVSAPRFAIEDPDWRVKLRDWITVLVADSAAEATSGKEPSDEKHRQAHTAGEQLLQEIFHGRNRIPRRDAAGKRLISMREKCWKWFQDRFKPTEPQAAVSDKPLAPYDFYRGRATELADHYTGLYRGTFFLNYLFAVLAVTLAAFCLVLLGWQHTGPVQEIAFAINPTLPGQIETENSASNVDAERAAATGNPTPKPSQSQGTNFLLLGLTLLKLLLVYLIFFNTIRANRNHWNGKAIDCRYVAERLRASFYLPLAGSFRLAVASQPQFATRVLRQSAMDWLLDAIERSVSPRDINELRADVAGENGRSTVTLRVDPLVRWTRFANRGYRVRSLTMRIMLGR